MNWLEMILLYSSTVRRSVYRTMLPESARDEERAANTGIGGVYMEQCYQRVQGMRREQQTLVGGVY